MSGFRSQVRMGASASCTIRNDRRATSRPTDVEDTYLRRQIICMTISFPFFIPRENGELGRGRIFARPFDADGVTVSVVEPLSLRPVWVVPGSMDHTRCLTIATLSRESAEVRRRCSRRNERSRPPAVRTAVSRQTGVQAQNKRHFGPGSRWDGILEHGSRAAEGECHGKKRGEVECNFEVIECPIDTTRVIQL